ncbi:MAG: SIS domain-containing protein [Alphaproteobacteria bacterium]|nr:SIS domain-containing protein [Alphaproteobacteria bacterium]
MSVQDYLQKSASIIEATAQPQIAAQVDKAIEALSEALRNKRAVLVCGNGGSASDAMHIAGELVGRFLKERAAQKCIALSSNPAVLTAWANDYSFETVFSRQVEAYGEKGGVFWGISTSGNSGNVIAAIAEAKKQGMTVIGLTGQGGGKMAALCDILVEVPSKETPFIQQGHLCLYHYICQKVEENLA